MHIATDAAMMTDSWIGQMRKGVAELCVLSALRNGEAYGYEILSWIRHRPSIALKESTLYLLLARLLKEGYVSYRSAASEKGPPRRYFSLTASGRRRLADMAAFWSGFSKDVDQLLDDEGRKDD